MRRFHIAFNPFHDLRVLVGHVMLLAGISRQVVQLHGRGPCRSKRKNLLEGTRSGLAPAPVKIGIGPRPAVRFKRSEILAWIEGGCKPVHGRAAQ